MKLRRLIPAMSIVLFLVLTFAGAYYVRRGMLERAMAAAIQIGDEKTILTLAESWPCPVNALSTYKGTALHWAADVGNLTAARRFLEEGADPNARMFPTPIFMASVDTPLQVAVERGHTEIARLLILKGADVNADIRGVGTRMGMAPLDLAAFTNSFDCVRLLVESGANVEGSGLPGLGTGEHLTPLCVAVEKKNREMAQYLLDHGASFDRMPSEWGPPFHHVVRANDRFVLELLITHHADINRRDADGETALHAAVQRIPESGSAEWVGVLLSHGADVSARDKQERTPLHVAAEIGAADVAGTLIAKGADVNARDMEGRTPLSFAKARREKIEKDREAKGQERVSTAIEAERPEGVRAIVEPEARPNQEPRFGPDATFHRYDAVIQLLLQHSAKESAGR